jgi:hypothetical protein
MAAHIGDFFGFFYCTTRTRACRPAAAARKRVLSGDEKERTEAHEHFLRAVALVFNPAPAMRPDALSVLDQYAGNCHCAPDTQV